MSGKSDLDVSRRQCELAIRGIEKGTPDTEVPAPLASQLPL